MAGLALIGGAVAWTVDLPDPERSRRAVAVAPAPAPVVRRFGSPAEDAAAVVHDTGDTGLPDPEVYPALDRLRAEGGPCGPGAAALAVDDALTRAAASQAAWLAGSGTRAHHTPAAPDGATPTARARVHGYRGAVGEILAWGHGSGGDAVAWWARSPTHCPVVIDPRWVAVGAAWHDGVWVVLFGDR